LNISEYINGKEQLKSLPFAVVYVTVCELVKDGYIKYDNAELSKADV
jgi:hypothetical protein